MPGQAIQIGPFVGGLNSFSDPTAVADNELVQCLNFELDLDGSLISRPPIVDQHITMPAGATGNLALLGYYYGSAGAAFLIGSDGLNSTYYFNGVTWILITNTISATAMTQYNDLAWLLAPVGSANPGGSWSPGAGFTPVPALPQGEVIVAHKERLWVAIGKNATVNGTRLYVSNVAAPTVWPGNFISIGSGDGQNIVQVIVYFNDLLIFRTNSIYRFAFSSDPATGESSRIVADIGLADKQCVASLDSSVYFMYDDKAYEMVNYRVNRINEKAPLRATTMAGIYLSYAVSIFNQRVIFSYFDTMFVFSLKTRTWTTWISQANGPIGKIYAVQTNSVIEEAIAHSSSNRSFKIFHIADTITTDAETMLCIVQTKNYNYEASSVFKRLFWWGADAVFRGQVTAVAHPVVFNYAVTWGQLRLAGVTWGQALAYTWGQPISGTLEVQTIRDTTGSGSLRKFVKFLKSLRFRQIYFKLVFNSDGSISTAPVRLFALMTYVNTHQRVSKTVS